MRYIFLYDCSYIYEFVGHNPHPLHPKRLIIIYGGARRTAVVHRSYQSARE